MPLKTRIEEDFKAAFKGQDKLSVEVLRMVKSEIKNREIEKKTALDDTEVLAVLSSAIKKRRESVEMFTKGNRPELADKEQKEVDYLTRYLPVQLGEAEIREKVKAVAAAMGNPDIKQMGQVMKGVMAEIGKQADGATVSRLVKEVLSGK